MTSAFRVVSLCAVFLGVAVGFALSVPGCCSCDEPEPISEDNFDIVSAEEERESALVPIEGFAGGTMALRADTVTIEYERPAGTVWTVHYRVTCREPNDGRCEIGEDS